MRNIQALLDDGNIFLALGGLETTLNFKTSFPLREMAGFEVLFSPKWRNFAQDYHSSFVDAACEHGRPMILATDTWRASSKWFDKLEVSQDDRDQVSKLATDLAKELANRMKVQSNGKLLPLIQGTIGPRGDAYTYNDMMTFKEASEYHRAQVKSLKEAGVDFIAPTTMTNLIEAKAIASESAKIGIPCTISFTVETDGRLPSGEALKHAICRIDGEVHPMPLLYMVNCVHPTHIEPVLSKAVAKKEYWVGRLRGVRANASAKSHDELDQSEELDEGNPEEWARHVLALKNVLPHLTILGGCCGTSVRHCEELGKLVHTKKVSRGNL